MSFLDDVKKLADERVEFVEATELAFHAGGDTRLAEGALKLIELFETYEAALKFYANRENFIRRAFPYLEHAGDGEYTDLGDKARRVLANAKEKLGLK